MGKLVAILTLIPVAAFAADGRLPDAAKVRRLTIAGVTERIPLPRGAGSWSIEVDALARTIVLHSKRGRVGPLLARLKSRHGDAVPEAREVDGVIELVCRTRRVEATLVTDKKAKAQYLDINELRGLPWGADGKDAPPSFTGIRGGWGWPHAARARTRARRASAG